MKQKQLFVTVQPYKRTSVRGNRHNVRGHFRTLSEFNLQNVLNPKLTTTIEVSPDTGKLLKQLIFTLSGALVVAAALRSR
jgi:hypothetical protein